MALSYELQGTVLHVTETTHSWRKTMVAHWYYDLERWMVSSYGRKGDVPDRLMTPDAILWVKTHYLPKVSAERFLG